MTREQALESALRELACCREINADPMIWDIHMRHARAALALPPDGVNADMLAALQLAQSLTRANCPTAEFVTKVNMAVNSAIARATGQGE